MFITCLSPFFFINCCNLDGAENDMVPALSAVNAWEYTEEGDERSLISVYDEIRTVSMFMKSLRKEICDLSQAIDIQAGIKENK